MALPRYEIESSKDGQYFWRLKALNGQILITSETYSTKSACRGGIASSRINSPYDTRYSRKTSSSGYPFFTLNAQNGQVLGTSEMYSSTAARDNGIEATKRDGPTTNEEDHT